MQAFLKKHGAGVACHQLKVNWEREGREVTIKFAVQKRDASEWYGDEKFGPDYKLNWGLWNTDVVEAFLQLRQTPEDVKAPYLEIQVSPLNQPFALMIEEPRKKFHAPENLKFTTTSDGEGRLWTPTLTVTLPPEMHGDLLYGGFYSCLLIEPREYYALEPNPEEKPDFHRPELFWPL